MSEIAKRLFEGARAITETAIAIAPGLKNIGPDLVAEGKREGTQMAMELAGALFNGNAFVPYGPGQYTPSVEHEAHSQDQSQEHSQEQSQDHSQDQSHEMHLERDGHER
jgi:hypothetical protein